MSGVPSVSSINTSSPVRHTVQGSERYASVTMKATEMKKKLQTDLHCHWVGPMPVQSFFEAFLDISETKLSQMPDLPENYFDALPNTTKEPQLYQPFIDLVSNSYVAPNFKLLNTSNHEDTNTGSTMKNKPDITAYDINANVASDQPTSFSQAEVIFEFKPKNRKENPFDDISEETTDTDLINFLWEPTAEARENCRGQLACYARAWMARQHRTHCFVVWIGDPHARIIRFDRSGGIVTELFNIRSKSRLLLEFLWRISCASPAMRGKDTTVSIVTDEATIKLAQEKLSQWAPVPPSSQAVLELQISDNGLTDEDGDGGDGDDEDEDTDDSDGDDGDDNNINQCRKVLVWGPLADPQCVVGRATRGYPAWDLKDKKLVFVKDSWRVVAEHISKETAILKTLNDAEVCNVPKLLYGDDVPGHMTITKDFANADWNRGGRPDTFSKRAHIRFTSDLIGTRITKFEFSKEFVQAWFDAFLAHQEAYEKCGILHRDISLDNILIKPGGGGILNDWDLARTLTDIETGPRQPSRSGTWQFMSVDLLGTPNKKHTLQDDLESFFWVLLYVTIRYLRTSIIQAGTSIAMIMHNIFDTSVTNGTDVTGGMVKEQVILHRRQIGPQFSVENNIPLSVLIEEILRSIKAYLNYWTNFSEEVERLVEDKNITPESAEELYKSKEKDLKLSSHVAMVAFGRAALGKEWPTDDRSFDRCGRPSKRPAADDEPTDVQVSETDRKTKRAKKAEE